MTREEPRKGEPCEATAECAGALLSAAVGVTVHNRQGLTELEPQVCKFFMLLISFEFFGVSLSTHVTPSLMLLVCHLCSTPSSACLRPTAKAQRYTSAFKCLLSFHTQNGGIIQHGADLESPCISLITATLLCCKQ